MTDLSPILIIDDQSDNRKELTQSLERVGFPVESASDGLQALDKFRSTKYSMVITNQQTPRTEGGDVLGSLKKISPQIPVIVIAANGTVHDAVEAMHAGASDYLLKPFSVETLEKTVKKTIRLTNGNGQSNYSRKSLGDQPIGKEIISRNRKFQDMLRRARSGSSAPTRRSWPAATTSRRRTALPQATIRAHTPSNQIARSGCSSCASRQSTTTTRRT